MFGGRPALPLVCVVSQHWQPLSVHDVGGILVPSSCVVGIANEIGVGEYGNQDDRREGLACEKRKMLENVIDGFHVRPWSGDGESVDVGGGCVED